MIAHDHNIVTLSAKAFAALSKFTLRIRKSIGVFKVAEILEDHRRACELFTQAVLSGDAELISLTKKANNELNVEKNLIKALGTYIQYIQSQAKSDRFIESNKFLLTELSKHLYGIELTGVAYRQAAGGLLLKLDEQDKAFCLRLIRDFYPHWKNANDILAEMEGEQAVDVDSQRKELLSLWSSIDNEFLTTLEECELNHYSMAIKKINVLNQEIQLRTKIAKVIIIKQRQYDKTSEGYRDNINEIQHYFSNERLIDYFLSVSREFYGIWLDSTITKDTKDS